ncbi:MAG: HEPN domain-containing protein [Nitrospinota bacterium]|nr:MAG: HEPN domain-containing protein [Nitrospinota bacterium]
MDMEVKDIVNKFKEYILGSEIKDKIAKIILFGSHAKGTATIDSDIDILVFTIDGEDVEKSLMDSVYDYMLAHDVPIEVITASIDDLFLSQDFFVYNVTHHGVEIYSMEKDDMKKIMVRDLVQLAEEYRESARDVLQMNRIRLAIDAAYNAAELATKALILLKEDDLPGSHGGVVSLFGQLYIKTKELDFELGRNLHLALKLRNEARYKPHAILSRAEAEHILELAADLISIALERNKA